MNRGIRGTANNFGTWESNVNSVEANEADVRYVGGHAVDTHSVVVGYVLWLFGFLGFHRFYFGKPITGAIWFFTLGLLGIGWIIDVFLIPGMAREANGRFAAGPLDYNLAWLLFYLTGFLGFHRFYQSKFISGIIYLLSAGIFGLGLIYDLISLNDQISGINHGGVR